MIANKIISFKICSILAGVWFNYKPTNIIYIPYQPYRIRLLRFFTGKLPHITDNLSYLGLPYFLPIYLFSNRDIYFSELLLLLYSLLLYSLFMIDLSILDVLWLNIFCCISNWLDVLLLNNRIYCYFPLAWASSEELYQIARPNPLHLGLHYFTIYLLTV